MTAATTYPDVDPTVAQAQPSSTDDVVVGVVLVVVLAVLGALAGLVWQAWAPARPAAEVLGGGRFIPDETEAFIAADGRYLVISAALGLVSALVVWFLRPANRGVAVVAGLVLGGLAGAALTELVGHLSGGGSATGKLVTNAAGQKFRLTAHLPLSLHMGGLVVVEAAAAALVYGLLVAFTTRDDLGRPDPVRDRAHAPSAGHGAPGQPIAPGGASPYAPPPGYAPPGYAPPGYGPPPPVVDRSVDAGGQPQHGGGHGDAAGPAQQRDLPPQ